MPSNKLKINSGITLLEVLISIAILGALSLIGVWHWSGATKAQALSKDKQGLVALLSEARSLSLSSKGASRYGVHVEEFQVILFKGDSYNVLNFDNMTYQFNQSVHMLSHSLENGGDDIVFSRLTGEVLNFGTIVLALRNDPLSSTTVIVKDTGVIE